MSKKWGIFSFQTSFRHEEEITEGNYAEADAHLEEQFDSLVLAVDRFRDVYKNSEIFKDTGLTVTYYILTEYFIDSICEDDEDSTDASFEDIYFTSSLPVKGNSATRLRYDISEWVRENEARFKGFFNKDILCYTIDIWNDYHEVDRETETTDKFVYDMNDVQEWTLRDVVEQIDKEPWEGSVLQKDECDPDEPIFILIIEEINDDDADIVKARSECNFTQEEVCGLIEIPLRTYQQWEQGKATPPAYVEKLIIREMYRQRAKQIEEKCE